ncbi:hypothetical protein FJM67_16280 [Maribrevibacterium harenarium]|uniref:Uncharacterized protein n=1 Tax=Maribrevibacterium harenarium TaxID=2589817 RepID=A0A501WEY0_9GAMM|nr:hypothetical protein [Maribrevibacterium harenarium]TPE45741.1 hypothetical protein FJM67_16280 [Maribrevibacterium harenarium]
MNKKHYKLLGKLTPAMFILSVICLQGCSVNPPQEGNYRAIADMDSGAQICAYIGKLSQTDVLASRRLTSTWMRSWGSGWDQNSYVLIFNQENSRANTYLQQNGPESFANYCSNIEAQLAQFKLEEQREHEKAIARAGATKVEVTTQSTPRSTTCNKIGTQVFCNSF